MIRDTNSTDPYFTAFVQAKFPTTYYDHVHSLWHCTTQDTLIVSAYMKEMFPHVLKGDMKQPIQYPPSWSLEFALDVDRALDVLGRAFHNKGFLASH